MDSDMDPERQRPGSSQKTMLSRALQKANTAVLLDNATNYEGAIEAYTDACELLQQVMRRSGGNDEKQKLEEIRNTYTTRIFELRKLGVITQHPDDKALPKRPPSDEYFLGNAVPPDVRLNDQEDDGEEPELGTAITKRIANNSPGGGDTKEPRTLAPSQIPPRRQSLLPSAFDEEVRFTNHSPVPPTLDAWSTSTRQHVHNLPPSAMEGESWARLPLPNQNPPTIQSDLHLQAPASRSSPFIVNKHSRDASTESTSWLDTIDESGASSSSSLRSRSSLLYIRPKHTSDGSGGTEAEFDAALDAAVEAAYDEGLEPASDSGTVFVDDIVSNARKNIELAKQKVREAERESEAALAKNREHRRLQQEGPLHSHYNVLDQNSEEDEAEEEERLLEEMMADFEFDLQSKSALPRQSASTSLPDKVWDRSQTYATKLTGTSFTPVAEASQGHQLDSRLLQRTPPSHPPPQPPPVGALPLPPVSPPEAPLPSLPSTPPAHGSNDTIPSGPGVRTRRLNGQNPKQLLIDTNARAPMQDDAPRTMPPSMLLAHPTSPLPKDGLRTSLPVTQTGDSGTSTGTETRQEKSKSAGSNSVESVSIDPPKTELSDGPSKEEEHDDSSTYFPPHVVGRVASAPDNLRKNISSSSLKALTARTISSSTPDISTQTPSTPSSTTFPSIESRKAPTPSLPVLPTPTGSGPGFSIGSSGGLYLFDSNIHSPTTPGSPNLSAPNAPIPLEPCPQSFLLRPFWLMRCLYQTLAHPRGGYLTAKLFIPKDVWRVQNVKIKGVEEKISNCDLLTAALLKLSKVDTYDADAVLEEMQSFENILDQVQNVWSKKLGNEVGVQGSLPLFKASNVEDGSYTHEHTNSKGQGTSGKSYLTSWRKLRSKSSGTSSMASASGLKDGSKDTLLPSLPMADISIIHPLRRQATEVQYSGPNANYMSALAKLFEAAQVLDQIARQVEDPGLRHSSQTLVGLELSTRHASEFFGFYVCRFALNDIGLMIDKFIKRGSEWVLV
ncbi:hypothetical protein AJ80_03036 [Polytolypa hystricis UAMH7299]|uniref:MIT domain-containing protein n=1 Tax=Polytolypa hystricis (strain UAMH7299) TaxID=1447883 RepID=A0A2B7YKR0_POLH7|nr:hypothetical protein AJ80_03036 [Polytolypa hystricis UAMH7299]